MKKDELIKCPCSRESDALYVVEPNPNVKIKMCYGCGFTSTSLLKGGEEFLEEQMKTLPELHKDLVWEDEDGNTWIPSIINQPKQGMIFANGSNASEWGWASVKSMNIPEEDREKFPIPGKKGEYYEHKMDMETLKTFGKFDFIEAMDYANVFENLEEK